MFTASQSGRARRAPIARPSPVPSCVDLPQPRYPRGTIALVERHDLIAGMAGVVGHDGAGAVDGPHQLPDDPVGAERPGVRGQPGHPPVHELRPHPGDLLRRLPLSRCGVAAVERVQHLAQDEPGVADAAEHHVVAAADVAGVVHDLAKRGRRGQRRDVERAGEARADAEDDVGTLEEPVDGGRPGAGGGPERERMVLGEGALAVQGRGNRDAGALGEPHELLGRAGVQHPLAGQDDRVRRLGQDPERSRRRPPGRPATAVAARKPHPSRRRRPPR